MFDEHDSVEIRIKTRLALIASRGRRHSRRPANCRRHSPWVARLPPRARVRARARLRRACIFLNARVQVYIPTGTYQPINYHTRYLSRSVCFFLTCSVRRYTSSFSGFTTRRVYNSCRYIKSSYTWVTVTLHLLSFRVGKRLYHRRMIPKYGVGFLRARHFR